MRWFGCQYSLVIKLQPADCYLNTECCLEDVGAASLALLYGNKILLLATHSQSHSGVFLYPYEPRNSEELILKNKQSCLQGLYLEE